MNNPYTYNLPPETSQDTSTETPAAYGPIVVEASIPDSSTMTGRFGGTNKIKNGSLRSVRTNSVSNSMTIMLHLVYIKMLNNSNLLQVERNMQ